METRPHIISAVSRRGRTKDTFCQSWNQDVRTGVLVGPASSLSLFYTHQLQGDCFEERQEKGGGKSKLSVPAIAVSL